MKENTLTDKEFWENYWENKPDLAAPVPKNILFGDTLTKLVRENNIKSSIELGGFPGLYAVFIKKYLGIESCLLDYFIHKPLFQKLLQANELKEGAIEVLETDLFQYSPSRVYDLVYSFGLIEHFEDPKPVLKKHIEFLSEKGFLYITLPNFRGVNGWIQKKLDPSNLAIHNLGTMDPVLLKSYLEEMGMEVLESRYIGKFTVWLEDEKNKPAFSKILKGLVWYAGKILTRPFALNSRLYSPYISLLAIRS